MNVTNDFEVKRYDFNLELFSQFSSFHYAKDLWPLVYILSDGKSKEAYVGETTDAYARMGAHLKADAKNKLTAVHLITSERFNKSATLDIESNLIKYISGDGQYKLLNANVGLSNHNYYQKKEVYWNMFNSLWDALRAVGISRHPIDFIDNSDLFKYSPYKTLNTEQQKGLLVILRSLLDDKYTTTIMEGGAGTGKTILAIFLFKLLNTDLQTFNFENFGDSELEFIEIVETLRQKYPSPKMALVVPMSSFRNTLKKVFKNVKGLNANMVIGPAEVVVNNFDIIIVDESHRLRRRVNLGAYFKAFDVASAKLNLDKMVFNELDWVLQQSQKTILFYDEDQSIKPSDVKSEVFDRLKANSRTQIEILRSQFRVRGGNHYVNYIDALLRNKLTTHSVPFQAKEYEFVLFDSITDLVSEIKKRENESGLSRLVAGYSWKWISKNNVDLRDITIDGVDLKWNGTANDWVNSPNAINEVGCIHTTQGYDLNYTGVIFGNEISYDPINDEIIIIPKNYHDMNGKQTVKDPEELKDFILNIYKTIMLRGIKGTYVYVCDKNLRDYFAKYINAFHQINHSSVLDIESVIPYENCVPIYNLKAAAGEFSEPQNVSEFEWIALPSRYTPSTDLFACVVIGESMNKIIPNGSICLFRKYYGGSRDGLIVLAQHSSLQDVDLGSGFTVKEYRSTKHIDSDRWFHKAISLKALSHDPSFSSIELSDNELEELKVIGIFECVLG